LPRHGDRVSCRGAHDNPATRCWTMPWSRPRPAVPRPRHDCSSSACGCVVVSS